MILVESKKFRQNILMLVVCFSNFGFHLSGAELGCREGGEGRGGRLPPPLPPVRNKVRGEGGLLTLMVYHTSIT